MAAVVAAPGHLRPRNGAASAVLGCFFYGATPPLLAWRAAWWPIVYFAPAATGFFGRTTAPTTVVVPMWFRVTSMSAVHPGNDGGELRSEGRFHWGSETLRATGFCEPCEERKAGV
ncbi:hypothetical protein MTO96_036433 [Rhipicephalus appendiculatus]